MPPMWETKADLLLETEAALELLENAMGIASHMETVVTGLFVAASDFFRLEKYDWNFKSPSDSSRYSAWDKPADLNDPERLRSVALGQAK